jgi:hypothetical protein
VRALAPGVPAAAAEAAAAALPSARRSAGSSAESRLSSTARISARCAIAAPRSSAFDGKWCKSAPRETFARRCTSSVVVRAKPTSISDSTAASSSARRVSSRRCCCVRGARAASGILAGYVPPKKQSVKTVCL